MRPLAQSGRRALLVGESWFTQTTHQKGFDSFVTSSYEEGCADFMTAVRGRGWSIDHIPCHLVEARMPRSLDSLAQYSAVVLSDVGSNTFLLGRRTFLHGEPSPDWLGLLKDYVLAGGGLLMVGGYMSFAGIEGKAGYGRTCLADVLPVTMLATDDRVECPTGVRPEICQPTHPIVSGLPQYWPKLLGFNQLLPRSGSEVLATCNNRPLLIVGTPGNGRAAAYASDLGPHWAPRDFVEWTGYGALWSQLLGWLAGKQDPGPAGHSNDAIGMERSEVVWPLDTDSKA